MPRLEEWRLWPDLVPRRVRLSSAQRQETVCRTNSFLAVVFLLLVQVTAVSGWSQQISSVSDEVLTLDQAIALALHENPSRSCALHFMNFYGRDGTRPTRLDDMTRKRAGGDAP